MSTCPICNSPAQFAFTTEFVKVNKCENKNCTHRFAVDAKPFQGVHNFEEDQALDVSQFRERNKVLIKYFEDIKFLKAGYKLLDFGSGTGHILQSLREEMPNINITSVEYGEEYHPKLQEMGCETYKLITDIPEEEKFDAITFIEVIEHLDNPLEILVELRKKLKKGGRIFLTTPGTTSDKKGAYNMVEHIHFFSEKSLLQAFKKTGYKKTSFRYINQMYPNKEYDTIRAKIRTLERYWIHWKGLSTHLTYFAS